MKICVGDVKNGKTYQRVLSENETDHFKGLKIGDKLKGEGFGLSGYELEIRGGSDGSGFPMRKGTGSAGIKKIYATEGVGIRKNRKGDYVRKTVSGEVIDSRIAQINLKVLQYGGKSVAESFGIEEKKEEPKKEVKEEKAKENANTPK